MQFDVDAWREALRTPAKLVFIANPSNPVGCACTDAQLAELISAVPEDCVLVLDEAYCEYAQAAGLADGLTLLAARQAPWISLRTFSKAYGLAGLRVGYGIASSAALINLLQRVRQPFPVNTVAQQAAVAALADTAHVAATVLLAAEGRQTVRAALESMGYQVAPSVANFLFFDAGENAAPLAERLLAHGVAVKAWREPGFETWARVTIGSDADNARFLAALAVTRAGRA
jgi:histidinol-phosphate aminotransferase